MRTYRARPAVATLVKSSAWALIGTLFLLSCSSGHNPESAVAMTESSVSTTYTLRVSSSPERSSSVLLEGATLKGNAYVFTSNATGSVSPPFVSKVTYWLDDPKMEKAPVNVEYEAPYDFKGTPPNGEADPWDTSKVSSGAHTITQTVETTSGSVSTITASFTVESTAPVVSHGPSWGRVGILQLWDYYMTEAELGPPTDAAKKTDWIWGGYAGAGPDTPSDWLAINRKVIDSRYFGISVDFGLPNASYPNRDLAWYQTNHPDWILYDCDGNNNPTKTVAYQPGWNHVPIDIHNADAVQFQVMLAAEYAKSLHFNALAADQIFLFNDYGGQGTNHDYWGCGIYSGGSFVRRYSPTHSGTVGLKTFPNYDPQYGTDMVNAVRISRQYLRANYPGMKLIINHPPGSISDPDEQALLENTDAALTELGTTNYGRYPSNPGFVRNAWAYAEFGQKQGTAMLNMNAMDTVEALTPDQIEWTLATYLMTNEGNSYLWLGASGSAGQWNWYSQYDTVNAKLGNPCAAYYGGASTSVTTPDLYYRRFEGGLVVANLSASLTQDASLPTGHAYTDLDSRTVSNPLPVHEAEAYVIFTTNGCE
jgi:hypothetical protein